MTTLVFDTHVYVKRLHAVGFSEEQAEVVVALQQKALLMQRLVKCVTLS